MKYLLVSELNYYNYFIKGMQFDLIYKHLLIIKGNSCSQTCSHEAFSVIVISSVVLQISRSCNRKHYSCHNS